MQHPPARPGRARAARAVRGDEALAGCAPRPHFAMTARALETSADLVCRVCGYNLCAHPDDGKCPECGESVAESRRWAAVPRRPKWRDSDPRWLRRMLVGTWSLVLLLLMVV